MQPKSLTARAGGKKYLKRQKTQKQLLFSVNLFRIVWVGSSRTLEPVISETTKWKLHPELPTEEACIIWSKHQQHPETDLCEWVKSNSIRLGKMSIVLVYCSVIPCLVTRTGYAGASFQRLPGLPVSFKAQGNFKPFILWREHQAQAHTNPWPLPHFVSSMGHFGAWNLCTLHPCP